MAARIEVKQESGVKVFHVHIDGQRIGQYYASCDGWYWYAADGTHSQDDKPLCEKAAKKGLMRHYKTTRSEDPRAQRMANRLSNP